MKTALKRALVCTICKKSLQPVMNKINLLGLSGMNYGNANTLDHSATGEELVIKYVHKKTIERQQAVLFDVGANAGNYSNLLAEVFQNNNVLICSFEPSRHTYPLLIKNTESA